ncbi:MAG: exopolysaccharide biosynthesis polyprenyl glycosylphosphotransferase [bacterium]|nr:MAG: exopolysaccharide biosynthesis polyprenyl glycosylphosphotransferase [bacterium]
MRKYSLALDNRSKAQQLAGGSVYASELRIKERNTCERLCKRSMDLLLSLLVLIVGAPFFLAIGLLIKLTSKGPVFFRQQRIGENGRPFECYKFRTMRSDTDDALHREFARNFIQGRMEQTALDENGSSIYKLQKDPRITAVGNFLRRTSLDELPQFINILRGEMTVVGPRPPVLYEYDCYEDWHKLRLKVKPGLTGLWQVSGRSTVTFHEMVMLDLYYIESWSLLLDFKIMLRTVPVMFAGTGAY